MTVLVTGGAGYIGGQTVLALLDSSADVVVLDDLSTGTRGHVPDTAAFVHGDIGDAALVRRTVRDHGVVAVLHFAARVVVADSVRNPSEYYRANAVGTLSLMEALAGSSVRSVILSSTAAVYGETGAEPVAEDHPLRPQSPYGGSKLAAERIVLDCARASGINATALRYFNVAGADPAGRSGQSSPRATHLIKAAMSAALDGREPFRVFGTDYPTPDGTCVRDFIHVADLAEAHLTVLGGLHAGHEIPALNCGYGRGFSVLQIVEAVKRIAGTDFRVAAGPRRAGDVASVVANADRLRRLGWQPRRDSLDSMIGDALRWERRGRG